jgi:hypothetical protein
MTLYTALNDWIPQPGRITRSWPSGLVLLQQDFIGNLDTLGPVAVPGDPFPADDAGTGAKVYGLPEYRQLDNGMTSATVSAYGLVPGQAGVQKVESLGAVSFFYKTLFQASYYYTGPSTNLVAYGELIYLQRGFNLVEQTSLEVRAGTGELQVISTRLANLKTIADEPIGSKPAGTILEGETFSSEEIFGDQIFSTVGIQHVSRTFAAYQFFFKRSEFNYYGSIWEERATFRAMVSSIDFGTLNSQPPPQE